MKKIILGLTAIFTGLFAWTQGTIQGSVTDAVTGDALIGANILIEGTYQGVMADLDGNFKLEGLAPGTYNVVGSFISYERQIIQGVVVKDGEVTIVNFALSPETFVIEQEAVVEAKVDRARDVFMENVKRKDPAMIDYISSQQIKKTGDSNAASALKRVSGVNTVGNYVFVRGLSDRYIKTALNGAEIPSLDPKRNAVQMDLFPTALIDNLVVVKTLNSNLPADYSGAYLNVITKDFPEEFSFSYSGSFGYNTNATFNPNFLTSAPSKTDWLGFDNGFRDVPQMIVDAGSIPQQNFSNYYEALVLAGFESELAAIGIDSPSDIGTGSGQTSITEIANQLDGVESVSQINNEFLPAARLAANRELSEMTQSFQNTWENERKRPFLDVSQSVSFGNQTKLFGKTFGYNVGIQYKKTNRFYENGVTGRYKLTGSEQEVNSLNTERRLTDSQGTESVYTSALLNLSYRLSQNNKIGVVFMPNVSGVNNSRYQIGINPSDEVGLGQEQRTQRYLERSMNVYQIKGEHLLDDFKNIKVNWIGSYTTGRQSTPDLRVFTNSFEEIPGGIVYYDADGNDITQEAEALLADGENLNEYYPGYTQETSQETTTVYSIRDNLYPSPTRYFREMKDKTLDLKLNIEIPFTNKISENNAFSFGGSLVNKTRDYSEQRYSFISNGLEYNGNPEDYFAPDNMQIVPGSSTGFIYLRDDTDLQNSYNASQTVLGAYGMVDLNVTNKLKVNAGLRVETTDMLLESDKIANSDLGDDAIGEFKGSLDLIDVLPALNVTYQLRKQDLSLTNLRFAVSQSVARPMFREKAPYSVFDFEVQEQQTGNTDLDRTLINNFDLRLEHFPGLGEVFSLSLFYKDFSNPIEQVINSTASNVEITWQNVDRAIVYGAEFEVRKSLAGLGEFWQPFGIGANLTLVHSATSIAEEELSLIRSTDPDHADTRPMFGQSPYIVNTIMSYDNDSIGLSVTASFNISGPKLVLVTKGGTPDVYDMPRGSLDVSVSKQLGEKFSLAFKAQNLLDPEYRKTYQFKGTSYDWQRYQLGRTFTLGFSYKI